MRVLGLIPARGGSKGIPGKNIRMLNDKPLIVYTIDLALKCEFLDRLIVSTDDSEIANISERHGAEVPFLRPTNLATDGASTVDVMRHALTFLKDQGEVYDAVCLLQPTTPFRTLDLVEGALNIFLKGNFDSVVTVREVPTDLNPHWVFESDESGCLKISTGEKEIIKRRQDLPPAYFRDGAVYITKASVIINDSSIYGSSTGFFVNKAENWVNLDTLQDWNLAEQLSTRFT